MKKLVLEGGLFISDGYPNIIHIFWRDEDGEMYGGSLSDIIWKHLGKRGVQQGKVELKSIRLTIEEI